MEQSEDSDAEIVQTDSGRVVHLSYSRACHDYTLGFASAFFMATTVLGYVILWQQHLPESLYATAVTFFVVFSTAGAVLLGIAYLEPVRFYELMEDGSEESVEESIEN